MQPLTYMPKQLAASLVLEPKEVDDGTVYLFLGVGDTIVQEAVATGAVGRECRLYHEGDAVVVNLEAEEPFARVTSIAPLTFWLTDAHAAA